MYLNGTRKEKSEPKKYTSMQKESADSFSGVYGSFVVHEILFLEG